jgi:hypothetical protein
MDDHDMNELEEKLLLLSLELNELEGIFPLTPCVSSEIIMYDELANRIGFNISSSFSEDDILIKAIGIFKARISYNLSSRKNVFTPHYSL